MSIFSSSLLFSSICIWILQADEKCISDLVDSYLAALYPNYFESTRAVLLRQARDLLETVFYADLSQFESEFLSPAAELIKIIKNASHNLAVSNKMALFSSIVVCMECCNAQGNENRRSPQFLFGLVRRFFSAFNGFCFCLFLDPMISILNLHLDFGFIYHPISMRNQSEMNWNCSLNDLTTQ